MSRRVPQSLLDIVVKTGTSVSHGTEPIRLKEDPRAASDCDDSHIIVWIHRNSPTAAHTTQ